MLYNKSSNKKLFSTASGGLPENPGAPSPRNQSHLQKDNVPILGGGVTDSCAQNSLPPSRPISFLKNWGGVGEVGIGRFPRSTRAPKVQSPTFPFCFWPRLNRAAGWVSSRRPDKTTARGREAGPLPHSPAGPQAAPRGARIPSGCASPSPAPQLGLPAQLRR